MKRSYLGEFEEVILLYSGVWMFALTAFIAVSIAFLTVGWQSLRAAMINPVASLKSE